VVSTLTTPFEPFLSQQWKVKTFEEFLVLFDRNMLAIKKAIQDANATIVSNHNAISNLFTTVNISFPSVPVKAVEPPGLDMGAADVDADMPLIIPGKPGQDGKPGATLPPASDGEDGDWIPIPGPQGAKGDSIKGPPGLQGDDGDEASAGVPFMEMSGLPLGALASEYTTTGDVATTLNGDSRIRANYARVVDGPYTINDPAVLSIEDGAILGVF
jgi:hypothetical protein